MNKALSVPPSSQTERSSVVTLQCKDGLINLARGGAAPDDLHLRGANFTKNADDHAIPSL